MEISYESRANEVIRQLNRQLSGPEQRLPYDSPEAALATLSMVADHYWHDPKRQEFVERSYEIASYLGGASIREVGREFAAIHDTEIRDYKKAHLRDSINIVARLATGIMEKPKEDHPIAKLRALSPELQNGESPITATLRSLEEYHYVQESAAVGILLLFEEVEYDHDKTRELRAQVTHWLQGKVARSDQSCPTIVAVIGSKRDAVHGRGMAGVLRNRSEKTNGKIAAAEVEQRLRLEIAQELARLFTPRSLY